LLAVTAFVTIATAREILWMDLPHWTVAAQTLRVGFLADSAASGS
jgi:hypothetical protein